MENSNLGQLISNYTASYAIGPLNSACAFLRDNKAGSVTGLALTIGYALCAGVQAQNFDMSSTVRMNDISNILNVAFQNYASNLLTNGAITVGAPVVQELARSAVAFNVRSDDD